MTVPQQRPVKAGQDMANMEHYSRKQSQSWVVSRRWQRIMCSQGSRKAAKCRQKRHNFAAKLKCKCNELNGRKLMA